MSAENKRPKKKTGGEREKERKKKRRRKGFTDMNTALQIPIEQYAKIENKTNNAVDNGYFFHHFMTSTACLTIDAL